MDMLGEWFEQEHPARGAYGHLSRGYPSGAAPQNTRLKHDIIAMLCIWRGYAASLPISRLYTIPV